MASHNLQSQSGFVDNWQSGKSLIDCNLHMLTSEDSCDVNFQVGKEKKIIRAHRYVLISRSCVFHAMLCGPLAEKDDIKIPDVEADTFVKVLRFLYTDESDPTSEDVTALLYLAKKYALGSLESICLSFLETSLSAENACVILEQAHVFDEKELYDRALKVIMENGDECLTSQGFLHLSRECFHKVLNSNDLSVKPEQIFNAALLWSEEECRRQGWEVTPSSLRSSLGETLYVIPFPNMMQNFYVKEVLPKQILSNEENVAIMAHLLCPDSDPSPFKQRQQKSKFLNVVFYSQYKAVTTYRFTTAGRIDFTCDHDFMLCGVYLYGSVKDTSATYHIRVQENNTLDSLENSLYSGASETDLQNGRVIAICLTRPVAIKKNSSFYVYVEVKRAGTVPGEREGTKLPQSEGESVRRNIPVGPYTFTKLPVEQNYINCHNLIHGFIVR